MNLRFLDHVALKVSDIEASANWYEEVLGLKIYRFEKEWGSFPIFALAGKSGIALFPTKKDYPKPLPPGDFRTMSHLAFNIDRENFEDAKTKLEKHGITYEFQDHDFFHSIYFSDPDGYRLEITTLLIDDEDFY
ncbi:VOC family protein [Fulvivirgaceae bacterium BMA10]|uniref:VOC family protein n=1 Tax=Splendidivirga corallicola TaxID=3051826 RepID=A0ABT8KTV2_9BACT|nr:VOC family protein [Fulvivirgaceae bacterium BMA10]